MRNNYIHPPLKLYYTLEERCKVQMQQRGNVSSHHFHVYVSTPGLGVDVLGFCVFTKTSPCFDSEKNASLKAPRKNNNGRTPAYGPRRTGRRRRDSPGLSGDDAASRITVRKKTSRKVTRHVLPAARPDPRDYPHGGGPWARCDRIITRAPL